jgi:hypothetical protein
MYRVFLSLLSGLVLTMWSASGWGFSTNLHQFSVIRDGSPFFVDTFSDGLQPPNSPAQAAGMVTGCGTSCYLVGGTFPNGSEQGNRLRLDTANGVMTENAPGVVVFNQRATLSLDTSPGPTQGLQASRTYEVSGLFDFVVPTVSGDVYSIILADRVTGNTMNDYVQVQVANAAGNAVIRFRKQNFVTDTITTFDSDPVSAANGDQVRLILSHPTANTGTIFASYEFLKAGVSQGLVQMSGSVDIYTGEIWTRPEFSTSSLVPEPHTYALMALGLTVVVGVARRARRAPALVSDS